MAKARSVVDTILGEAVSGTRKARFEDMKAIASVISNRATLTSQPPQSIVSAPGQFNAYGKSLPKGVEAQRALAQKAWAEVQATGPVNNATFYATPAAVKNLPGRLSQVASTLGHQYFADPLNRAIATAVGYVTPSARPPASIPGPLTARQAMLSQEVSRPARMPGLGMQALAPHGLLSTREYGSPPADAEERSAIQANLADVGYNMGAHRPNKPAQDVVDTVRSAVRDALGPGYSVSVTSGTEDPGKQFGSNRHKTGLAVDFEITDPTGRKLNSFQDKQALVDVAQAAAAKGIKGIGIGTNYMGGIAMHMDKFTPGPGQANQWGNIGKENAALFDNARTFKEMPASFYSKSLPSTMSAPPSRLSPTSPLTAAPVGKVQRASLPAIDSQKMTAVGGPVSPARPDNLSYAGPIGKFSVPSAPAISPSNAYATTNLPSVSPPAAKTAVPSTAAMGMLSSVATAAPQSFTPQATALMPAPARPPVAPVPAAAVPKPAVAVAAPATPSYSRQAVAPARPSLSAADVYGGAIGTAQTSTPGTTVSRAASYGPTYTTNKFGAVTATAPDGTQMAAWGGVPASKPAISGPLGNTGIATTPSTSGMFGPKAKSATGMLTGAAIGGYALGPLGAALGGMIGKNMAQGKSPLSGILGGKSTANPGMRTVDTYAGKMTFSNPVGGLGFPSAPAAPRGAYTGPKGGSGGLSSQARDALGKNNGLY